MKEKKGEERKEEGDERNGEIKIISVTGAITWQSCKWLNDEGSLVKKVEKFKVGFCILQSL